MVRVVLAEDHPVVREGLRALLEGEADFEVVGETGEGGEVARLVDQLRPDVAVVDLVMPGMGGLEVTRHLRRCSPETRVVILSMHGDEAYVLAALRTGAAGYALKQSDFEELCRAIREAAEGRRYLSPPLSERALEAYARRAEGSPRDPYDTLTPRQREVLELVARGHTNSEIGKLLYIGVRTVETHRAKMMEKLGLENQAQVVRYALRRRLLPEV